MAVIMRKHSHRLLEVQNRQPFDPNFYYFPKVSETVRIVSKNKYNKYKNNSEISNIPFVCNNSADMIPYITSIWVVMLAIHSH